MKKNIIVNILLTVIFLLSVALIILSVLFLHDIKSAPQLLVHIIPTNGSPPYYLVQNELVDKWSTYCIVLLSLACILALISVICFLRINIFISDEEKNLRKTTRKAAKIAALEEELDRLKRDGE